MSITESDVRHVASLARVGLDDDRIPQLVSELNGILEHMDALQGVAAPEHDRGDPPVALTLQDDVVGAVVLGRALGDFAPFMRDGFFLVPKLATHTVADAEPS